MDEAMTRVTRFGSIFTSNPDPSLSLTKPLASWGDSNFSGYASSRLDYVLRNGSRATDPSGANFVGHFLNDDILTKVQQLGPIASDCGLSMAQLAVAWVLQNENVASAIVGASRPEQLDDNIKASGVRLEADVLKRIDEVLGDVVVRDAAQTKSPRSPR